MGHSFNPASCFGAALAVLTKLYVNKFLKYCAVWLSKKIFLLGQSILLIWQSPYNTVFIQCEWDVLP